MWLVELVLKGSILGIDAKDESSEARISVAADSLDTANGVVGGTATDEDVYRGMLSGGRNIGFDDTSTGGFCTSDNIFGRGTLLAEVKVALASLFYKLENVRSTQIELVLGGNTDFGITHMKQGVGLTLVFKRNLGPNHFYRPFSLLHSVNKISSH